MLLPMGLPPDVSVIAWGLSLERSAVCNYIIFVSKVLVSMWNGCSKEVARLVTESFKWSVYVTTNRACRLTVLCDTAMPYWQHALQVQHFCCDASAMAHFHSTEHSTHVLTAMCH